MHLRAEQLVGQVVEGRYRVERVLGHGGMGTVYACRHAIVGKALAMKVLRPPRSGNNDGVLQRFIREAQTANALKSRHIIETTDFGQLPDGPFFVVMELLEGFDLAHAMRDNRLNAAQLLHVFTQIADTLEIVHANGIVHRDLKPDNVFLVDENGDPLFVKLLDFGIAKVLNSGSSHLTEEGMVLGTPHYMAPEQARSETIDSRADIYAFGVMMYRAFTGRLPFVADSAIGVMTRHAMDPPEPPSRFMGIDRHLEALILRCMAKRPDERPQRMAEVAQELRMLLMKMTSGFPIPLASSAPYVTASNPAVPALSHPVHPGVTGSSQALAAMPMMLESAAHRALVTSSTGMSPPVTKPKTSPTALFAFVAVALLVGGVGAFAAFGMRGESVASKPDPAASVDAKPAQAANPPATASVSPVAAATTVSSAEPASSAQATTPGTTAPVRPGGPISRPATTTTTTTKPSHRPEIRNPFE